jgi:hypothetical protein
MREDTKLLDWLSKQRVEVLIPRRWGHKPGFQGEPDLEDETWDLRAAIRAARGEDK